MTRSPVRLGVQFWPEHTTYQSMRELWLRVEGMGFDTIYTWDHFYPLTGDHTKANFECWSLLAAIAESTSRIHFGALVTGNSYRHPAVLAKIAATVDHISNGRLILGVGAGWDREEYDAYGIPFGTPGDRLRALEESLVVLKSLLGPDATSDFAGKVYQLTRARAEPKPVQQPLPILIGGGGERVTLRLVATYADMSNWFGSPEAWAAKNALLDQWCERVGRTPGSVRRSVDITDPTNLDRAEAYVEAGCDEIIVGIGEPWPHDRLESILRRFGR